MSRMMKVIKKEIIEVIPAVIFFMISFNLIVLTENLIIRHDKSGYLSYVLATVFALVVGKCLIIIHYFPYINVFAKKPLIYNILWKFFIYSLFILAFRITDKVVHLTFDDPNSKFIYHHLHQTLISPAFWAIQIWLLMLFCVYIVSTEFIDAIGRDKIIKLLLG
jgi:hypothetical protein